ncbi:MAG: response regulator [Bacteroidia bacterium]
MTGEIKIIIIEDNPSDADLLHREMKQAGLAYTSIVVETKAAFEEALSTFNADIILSDYSLPSFDAVTAFFIKQKKYPHIPFIIVSSIFGEENAVDLIKNGVTDYVPKDNLFTLIPKIHRGLKDAEERRVKIATDEKLRIQTAELILANIELAFQNKEKEKRAAELALANKELAFQNQEKGQRAAELLIANQELALENEKKEQRAAELALANEELAFQNKEKEKRAAELVKAYKELKQAEEYQEEYILGLEEMMFMTSHKLRVPITNIIGISEVLDQSISSPDKLRKMVDYIKKSAIILDDFTKELSVTMEVLEQKVKNKIKEVLEQ